MKVAAWAVLVGLLSLAGLAIASWVWKWEGFWRGAGQPYATVLAALAAVTAAAIALHNSHTQLGELRTQRELDHQRWVTQTKNDQDRWEAQRQDEQTRWTDQRRRDDIKDLRSRFAEATEQLAHDRPAIRRSGAYAMAALVKDWRELGISEEAKVCLSVLAAYVTSPNPTYTADGTRADAGSDGPIRALIVSLICQDGVPEFGSEPGDFALLKYADLRAVEFQGSLNNVISFSGSQLQDAQFIGCAIPDGMLFDFAKLNRARLYNVNLKYASLTFADLSNASLDWAKLHGANLSHADLVDTSVNGVSYDPDTRWPNGYQPPKSMPEQ